MAKTLHSVVDGARVELRDQLTQSLEMAEAH